MSNSGGRLRLRFWNEGIDLPTLLLSAALKVPDLDMSFKFVHTADWQIGKVFRFVDETTMGVLQEARLNAISRLGKLAEEHEVKHILVAGDVYDREALKPVSRNKPIERMRAFPNIQWHLLPGNHDPHRLNGLWDQLLRTGLAENVHVYLKPGPVTLEPDVAVLLPAPLYHKRSFTDPTHWMDDEETPEGIGAMLESGVRVS